MAEQKTASNLDIKAPFYAAVGFGDLALAAVSDIVEKIRETAEDAASEVRAKVDEARDKHLPKKAEKIEQSDIKDILTKFSPEELRKVAEAYSKVALDIFSHLAERGEEATKRLLKSGEVQDVKNAVANKADQARELTDEALGKVASGTRALGERASKATNSSAARRSGAAAKKSRPAAK
ncbi:heparin-binding hemagglutinin (adhesin) [Segniliparus rotundus DSM 44985]|uniref:Heparin-binding hemagglutinin (Adhesin) n=1 Tax=Segniliparus rotundus (strain ATCC BAA-972 / CDC 1076 / CIP 108378 / DSM 44985 / JCM 13578) TaxID=640132 RepID=D6Z7L6_SEGRD|nr:hypothetical protein [Segniliparus rotundus]ADG97946.1 heparin-binding hemagglutinin (adhesin) [Segniliparus rotundus DSM 44985]